VYGWPTVTQTFHWQCLMDEDTDTLLALVCSLLPDNITPSQESLLDALLQTDGDVEKAAEIISKQRLNSKRKRKVSLDSWLIRTTASSNDANGQSSSLHSRLGSGSTNKKPRSAGGTSTTEIAPEPPLLRPVKPVDNLLDFLRQPLPVSVATGTSVPRLPPLTLSNPSLVAQHTPCTHHLGILPAELACRLFYTMLHEARDWPRNKWWLVDRLVESPHRSSLYTRHPVEGKDEAAWQGITRAW
jgi:hypothetical protein